MTNNRDRGEYWLVDNRVFVITDELFEIFEHD